MTSRSSLPRSLATYALRIRSPKTIKTYAEAVDGLARFLTTAGMPTRVSAIRREHIESYIENILHRWTASTALNRYQGLRQFFRFLTEDGEISESPMARMTPPKVPEAPPPVLTDDELRALLKAADGNTFEQRRDLALLRVLIDTGARVSEIANLTIADVDLNTGTITVVGKGRRVRVLPLGAKSVRALDRYLRARTGQPRGVESWLWLGSKRPAHRLRDPSAPRAPGPGRWHHSEGHSPHVQACVRASLVERWWQ
jgi:site-specific recombinase XerD